MSAGAGVAPMTEDHLLGGRVALHQPAVGERVAIDPVLLAAAVPARAGDTALDAGCGSGAAALCLAHRVAGVRVVGLDQAREAIALATANAARNGLGESVTLTAGDILAPPRDLAASFDHVMANPPHLEAARAAPSPEAGRRAARIEGPARLRHWIEFCVARVRRGGTLTLIHRADRLADLLGCLGGVAGGIVVYPLWPGGAKPAKRVIVRAEAGSARPLGLTPGMVLHTADGAYTRAAEAVLRHGAGLEL